MTPAVEVEDVFRVYATDEGTAAALQGLSLTVHEGEIVAVLGPSGSGKTTLLRILAGLDRPSAGRVRVAGVDLRRLRGRGLDRYRSRRLGYADQRYTQALAPELTAGELVSLRLALAGESPRERRRRATELLGQVGLEDRLDAYPHELSGGEQQRVALCAALPTARGSCSPTSRPVSSTQRTPRSSTSSSASWPARRARPRSSSATTRAPRRSPTASFTSATDGSAPSRPRRSRTARRSSSRAAAGCACRKSSSAAAGSARAREQGWRRAPC